MPDLQPRKKTPVSTSKQPKRTVLTGFGGSDGKRESFLSELFKGSTWGFVSTWGIVTIIFALLIGAVFGRYSFFEQYTWTLALTFIVTYFIRNPPNILLAAPLLNFLSNMPFGGAIRTVWSALVVLFFVMLFVNFNRYQGAKIEALIVQTLIDMRMIVGAIFSEVMKLFG